ncbi:histidine kinase [Robbsia andropogonis]|uniref:histidine kinase n=1 Tax=Robbsia andropogonis TaxID=28092 RepID=A0A0F5K3W6_9BURK|nr:PAS domain-containing sensor histidine kinase [Robbsia andropogonis]KKB64625.1 histidine kinase [Robbsia andropogonis]MCP1117792.1 PAS domain-containing sensor histidine kinase [Robbsia andropogonis]MCP1127257.1 PAS domain-containing sensor histidine kinase [Robbsia andropogonis]
MKSSVDLRTLLVRVLVTTVALTATLLLVLLALASANTEFFDRYYSWLYTANVAVAFVFLVVTVALVCLIAVRLRQGKFGTRLLAKIAIFFALVGVLPGGIIYLVSLQFASRSIESWFDVNVETALDSGLALGRGMLDNSLSDLQAKGRTMADQLAAAGESNTTLTLLRLRDQFNIQQAQVISRAVPMSTPMSTQPLSLHYVQQPALRILAEANQTIQPPRIDELPNQQMLAVVSSGKVYAATEGDIDAASEKGVLRMRVLMRIPYYQRQTQGDDRYLQLIQPVSPTLARNAEAVQRAYREYQEKSLGRTGLRKMYIGTLTLALFLATFIGIMLALVLGNQLARPLFLLARGTEEVARGDYTPKHEIKSNDELGFLTQMFNAMTRQLSEAQGAVEANRLALEESKAYLESILANLTAGVFVFDWQFRLTTANPGADRIFRKPFQEQLGKTLFEIEGLADFGVMVRKAFADREAADRVAMERETGNDGNHDGSRKDKYGDNRDGVEIDGHTATAESDADGGQLGGDHLAQAAAAVAVSMAAEDRPRVGLDPRGPVGHWQQQFAIPVAGETEPLTLLVRGTRLLSALGNAATAGYVVVFDDISDVISAQRSVAWGEVARRLAHEIKNPLTPIQLSAERLQMKLSPKLDQTDADVLKRGATTIVNQVAAMKRMVDDFREYARTPPAVLQPLQLNDLVAEVMTLYGVDDGKGAITVSLEQLPAIKGDATQLRQVIHNLLQNAQDAVADAPRPQVTIETRPVEYGDADEHGNRRMAVRLAVSDNGPGFPARILTRAFEPYVTTKAKGTGLGLAMVKKIVDEHGGRIDIRNRGRMGQEGVAGAQVSILFLQLDDAASEPRQHGSEDGHASQAKAIAHTRVG